MEALVTCRPRRGARLLWVDVFREYWGVYNANLAQEGSWGCSLVRKNQFESYTSALRTSTEAGPDPAR